MKTERLRVALEKITYGNPGCYTCEEHGEIATQALESEGHQGKGEDDADHTAGNERPSVGP